jgi:hypothetical protein
VGHVLRRPVCTAQSKGKQKEQEWNGTHSGGVKCYTAGSLCSRCLASDRAGSQGLSLLTVPADEIVKSIGDKQQQLSKLVVMSVDGREVIVE